MPSELFDTVPGFDWKHIKSDASTRYTDVYRNTLLTTLTRIEETKQKCFIVVAEGTTSYGPRNHIYCVFSTIIIHYMSDPCIPNWYTITEHRLGIYGLKYFKTYKISEGRPVHELLPIFQSFESELALELRLSKKEIIDYCEIQKQVVRTDLAMYKGLAEKYRKELYDERLAFEKEKRTLETEMAKYKGIVENCRKEISSYGF